MTDSKVASASKNEKKMKSRMGKKTEFDFAILKDVDPLKLIDRHHKHMKFLEKKGLYDKTKKERQDSDEEEKRDQKIRDNSMKSKTDLNDFIRMINQ